MDSSKEEYVIHVIITCNVDIEFKREIGATMMSLDESIMRTAPKTSS